MATRAKETKGLKKTLGKGTKLRVLVAEDNAKSRVCIEGHLEVLGYDVIYSASSGKEALTKSLELRPDLIIMDYKMPEMTGVEVASKVTEQLNVPIVLVTGHDSEDIADEAVEAGIFSYLIKPITKKQLLPAIKLAFARYKEMDALTGEVTSLREALEARKVIEQAKGILMRRCKIGEDDAFKLLQTQSQNENKKMSDIASMVVSASKMI